MRVIAGLGNSGSRYEGTRHNAGFMLIDFFANQHGLIFNPAPGNYQYSKGEINNSPFILIKPTSYMNNSGISILNARNKIHFEMTDLLVCYDDINIKLGQLKIRLSGGGGGHNGLNSILYHLETDKFPRIRIGVGADIDYTSLANYVLDNFKEEEKPELENSLKLGSKLLETYITTDIQNMLNIYSTSVSNSQKNVKKEEKSQNI